jgi:hypothetical protein
MKQRLLDEDTKLRARNIPFAERKIDFEKLAKCDRWIDWLERLSFSHVQIYIWAVENTNLPTKELGKLARQEALYYFETYVC